jgi:hypothetical protein
LGCEYKTVSSVSVPMLTVIATAAAAYLNISLPQYTVNVAQRNM